MVVQRIVNDLEWITSWHVFCNPGSRDLSLDYRSILTCVQQI
ncbi:hypothetical protein MPTK2_3g10460 [Marchantia polymorpha subsp. ruderalis]